MWYDSFMPNPKTTELDSLIGKPIVVYKDRKRRVIGTIRSAHVDGDGLQISASITDNDLRRRLDLPIKSIGFERPRGILQSA